MVRLFFVSASLALFVLSGTGAKDIAYPNANLEKSRTMVANAVATAGLGAWVVRQ